MANNRMWLVNDRLGKRVLLAKYYPSTGWYMVDSAGADLTAADETDNAVSQWGPVDWRLEYEMAGDTASSGSPSCPP